MTFMFSSKEVSQSLNLEFPGFLPLAERVFHHLYAADHRPDLACENGPALRISRPAP
jgi:hypothetical protein